MDKVVIAAVEGPCAGIGCAYYMSSDIVFMGQSSFFQIGFQKLDLFQMVVRHGFFQELLAIKELSEWLLKRKEYQPKNVRI